MTRLEEIETVLKTGASIYHTAKTFGLSRPQLLKLIRKHGWGKAHPAMIQEFRLEHQGIDYIASTLGLTRKYVEGHFAKYERSNDSVRPNTEMRPSRPSKTLPSHKRFKETISREFIPANWF